MPWLTRMKIALDAANGLAFLHGAERPIIYRDFKTSNILLDSVCLLPPSPLLTMFLCLQFLFLQKEHKKAFMFRESNQLARYTIKQASIIVS